MGMIPNISSALPPQSPSRLALKQMGLLLVSRNTQISL